eukprot:scaffold3844_cov105-Cylindrotheca_fusiformis.AAC.6
MVGLLSAESVSISVCPYELKYTVAREKNVRGAEGRKPFSPADTTRGILYFHHSQSTYCAHSLWTHEFFGSRELSAEDIGEIQMTGRGR